MNAASESAHSQLLRLSGLAMPDALRRVLAGEDLRARARVIVVASGVVAEPFRRHVIVLVDDVGLQSAHLRPTGSRTDRPSGDGPALVIRADLRILLLEHSGEYLVALDVLRTPLFVADADHLQVERRGVTHRGAARPHAVVTGALANSIRSIASWM